MQRVACLSAGGEEVTCKLCLERGKTWEGDDPVCFWDEGSNWCCVTLGEFIYEFYGDLQWWEDQCTGHFLIRGYPTLLTLSSAIALWITRYKHRGHVEQVLILFDDQPPRKPTEEEFMEMWGIIREGKK